MRFIQLRTVAICVVCAMLVMLASHKSSADVTFMVTHILDVDIAPFLDDDTVAINDAGEIVGSFEQSNGDRHAFVWLPAANYGLDQGFHDLHLLAWEDGQQGLQDEDSIAYDINNAGFVVGRRGDLPLDIELTDGEAIVWQLADPAPVCALGFYAELDPEDLPYAWSVAYSLNNDDPPVVVGDMLTNHHHNCSQYRNNGFRTAYCLTTRPNWPNPEPGRVLAGLSGSARISDRQ